MKNIAEKIIRPVKFLIQLLTILMIVIILYGVLSRYVLHHSISWYEELAVMLMIWIVFLGSSIALHQKEHIGMTVLKDKLKPTVKKYFDLGILTIILIFLAIVCYGGFKLAFSVIPQKTPSLRISYFWAYSSLPVGCVLMMVQVLDQIIEILRGKSKGRS
jgi:TRAP-type C4-dicarboxylate transport system permease small subunit